MAPYDNAYSRLVGWLKLLLPLAALALLSSVFLLNTGPRDSSAIPFAEIEALAREQRISEPSFSGVSDDGTLFAIAARSARPEGDGDLAIETLDAQLDAADGSQVTLSAGSGAITDGGRQARLDGLVRMNTSTGYRIETEGAVADLDVGRVTTIGPLEARAPFGDLTAGGLLVETRGGDDGGSKLFFTGGVRLVYLPPEEEP